MADNENLLIAQLPRKDRDSLLALAAPVELSLSEVLFRPGELTSHVYFPLSGFVSLVVAIDCEPGPEVGMVGREGMAGAQLAVGVALAPLHALVQGAGVALRVEAQAFRFELARNAALRAALNRYLFTWMAQLATSAACLRFHQIEPRLARWLLMSQDRAMDSHLHVTHEFLAYMLGVRRVGVTRAAGALHRKGLIEYRHGELTVIDRAGLEGAACTCYAANKSLCAAALVHDA